MIKTILIRLSSVFVATAIPNIGVGAAVGVEVWRASVMSGAIACLAVVQSLAKAYRDGTLTQDEVDKAFGEG